MLKHLPRSAMDFVLLIFNLFCSLHCFTSFWKASSIILIHKLGEPFDSAASFWPISLNFCVSKLFGKMGKSWTLCFLEPVFLHVELTLPTLRFRSNPPFFSVKCSSRSPFFSPISHNLVIRTDSSFRFGKGGSSFPATSSLCGAEAALFRQAQCVQVFCSSLRHRASSFLVSEALASLPSLFPSPPVRLAFCPCHADISSSFLLP